MYVISFTFCLYSHSLLKQITDVEGGGGAHKGGGTSGGGGKGGGVDAQLREKVTLFRLTTDAMVKVRPHTPHVLYTHVYTCMPVEDLL